MTPDEHFAVFYCAHNAALSGGVTYSLSHEQPNWHLYVGLAMLMAIEATLQSLT